MSNPSSASVVAFRASNGGNWMLVPRKSFETRFAGGDKTSQPTPTPATNRRTATTATMTIHTPFAPRIASAGGAAPPAAMSGANACHYLNVAGDATRDVNEKGQAGPRAFTTQLGGGILRGRRGPRRARPSGCSGRGCNGA